MVAAGRREDPMDELLQSPEPGTGARKTSRSALLLTVCLVAAIGLGLWLTFSKPSNKRSAPVSRKDRPAMSLAQQEYAKNIRVQNLALSRAENFLHQEVTILNAEAVNDGKQQVEELFLTVQFSDDLNQIVLRETRGVLGSPSAILAPGESRAFELSFDRLPMSWNRQLPAVSVSSLQVRSVN